MKKRVPYVDHPADNQIDYNSIIDFLEEEHLRRDVFTTVVDHSNNDGQVSADNPSYSLEHSYNMNNIVSTPVSGTTALKNLASFPNKDKDSKSFKDSDNSDNTIPLVLN